MKKNEKGFTLIELIVIIGILGVILAIGTYFVVSLIKASKEEAVKLTNDSLYNAAKLYVSEFKTTSDNWYIEYDNNVKTGNEYACTTIKMLIDKGFLSNNLINPDTKEKIEISKYVKVSRNTTTKVLNSEAVLDSLECKEYDTISPSVNFTYNGTKGNNDWYVSNVTINVEPIIGVSGVKEYSYYVKSDLNTSTKQISNNLSNGILLNDETKNIQVCVTVTNGIDNVGNEKCSDKIKIDKTGPSNPSIDFDNDYNITISNSTDNLSNYIKYYYSIDDENYNEGSIYESNVTTSIYAYTEDEAGNNTKNSPVVKNVFVENAQNGEVTSSTTETSYECSKDGEIYSTNSEATNACTYAEYDALKSTTSTTKYYCSYTEKTYSTKAAAISACSESTTYTGTRRYLCPDGSYSSNNDCSYDLADTVIKYNVPCNSSCSWSAGSESSGLISCSESNASLSCTLSNKGVTRKTCSQYNYSQTCTYSNCIATTKKCPSRYTYRSDTSGTGCYGSPISGRCTYGSLDSDEGWCYTSATTTCSSAYVKYNGRCCKQSCTPIYRFKQTTSTCGCSGASTYGGKTCTSNCNSNKTCASGYTKNASKTDDTCPTAGSSCSSSTTCSNTWSATCDATGSVRYYCSESGTYQTSSSCSSSINHNVETISGTTSYYCASGYTCSGNCTSSSTCSKTLTDPVTSIPGTTSYYCSLDSIKYNTNASATQACSNVCLTGTLHNGKCYSLS